MKTLTNTQQDKLNEYLEKGGNDYFSTLKSDPTTINQLGILLSKIPINPKYAKMLIVSSKYNVLKYAIMMVACISVGEIFSNQ